jgi:SAM-dependent methyltransferase
MSVDSPRKSAETSPKYPGLEHQPVSGRGGGALVQSIRRFLRAQFGHPTGFVGSIAGKIMARRPSNLDRIRWVISLLEIRPKDRVLEIGFGPGVAIKMASEIAAQGFVAGIDHSKEMARQATRRNSEAVRNGRVALYQGSAASPPAFDEPFDKVFTINSIHFWENPVQCLDGLRRLMKPQGLIAVAIQPRSRTATDETTAIIGDEIAANLKRAGFTDCRVEIRKTSSTAVACILGRS